jgi:hypothetical protein
MSKKPYSDPKTAEEDIANIKWQREQLYGKCTWEQAKRAWAQKPVKTLGDAWKRVNYKQGGTTSRSAKLAIVAPSMSERRKKLYENFNKKTPRTLQEAWNKIHRKPSLKTLEEAYNHIKGYPIYGYYRNLSQTKEEEVKNLGYGRDEMLLSGAHEYYRKQSQNMQKQLSNNNPKKQSPKKQSPKKYGAESTVKARMELKPPMSAARKAKYITK